MTRLPSQHGQPLADRRPGAGGLRPMHIKVGGLEVADAKHLLASLGFLLVPGPPQARGPAYLLIALRHTQPTLSHFDPERIALWTSTAPGRPRSISNGRSDSTQAAIHGEPSKSSIGWAQRTGLLRSAARSQSLVVVTCTPSCCAADAPILSAGGHSDPADPVGTSVGAFFGVLRASAGDDQRDRHACQISFTGDALLRHIWLALLTYMTLIPTAISLARVCLRYCAASAPDCDEMPSSPSEMARASPH